MEHENLSSVVRQFKQTFSEQVLNALGGTVLLSSTGDHALSAGAGAH
jgi:hypothetical protein